MHLRTVLAPHLERIIRLSNGSVVGSSAVDKTIAPAWGWDCLSRIFHIGTQIGLRPGESMPEGDAYCCYIEYCASIVHKILELKVERPGKVVALPPPDLSARGDTTLRQALHERQTWRSFDAEALPLGEVSTALWATFSTVHGETREDLEAQGLMPIVYQRTSPSGGCLHPSEAYLVAMRVSGLTPGIYHYRSHRHELSIAQQGFAPHELGPLLCAQTFANDMSYGVFVTCGSTRCGGSIPIPAPIVSHCSILAV